MLSHQAVGQDGMLLDLVVPGCQAGKCYLTRRKKPLIGAPRVRHNDCRTGGVGAGPGKVCRILR